MHERKPGHRHQNAGALLRLGSLCLPRAAAPDCVQFFPVVGLRLRRRLFIDDRREWRGVQLFPEFPGRYPGAGEPGVLASRSKKCTACEDIRGCLERTWGRAWTSTTSSKQPVRYRTCTK